MSNLRSLVRAAMVGKTTNLAKSAEAYLATAPRLPFSRCFIEDIKAVRFYSGLGLKEAKDIMDLVSEEVNAVLHMLTPEHVRSTGQPGRRPLVPVGGDAYDLLSRLFPNVEFNL